MGKRKRREARAYSLDNLFLDNHFGDFEKRFYDERRIQDIDGLHSLGENILEKNIIKTRK